MKVWAGRLSMAIVGLGLWTAPVQAGEITLSAAASLKEALNDIADVYLPRHPGVSVRRNFGASGVLAQQINHGLEADIFISAHPQWLDFLHAQNLADASTATILAYNELVVVGPPEKQLVNFQDLAAWGPIAVGSPRSVPAGEYAQAAFKNAGILPSVEKKWILSKDVRAALQYAERGDVDAALVYRTDARLSPHVRVLLVVPAELYGRVSYPMALTVRGARDPDAVEFYAFLQAAEAQGVLAKYGFVLP